MKMYVATYRPPYPEKGVKVIVWKEKEYSRDIVPATVTSLWEVDNVKTRVDAISCVIEKGAGKNVTVRQMI